MLGTVSKQSNLTVQANTSDLRELSALVSEIRAATALPGRCPSAPLDIRGPAQFSGQVSGAVEKSEDSGPADRKHVEVEGSRWRSIRTERASFFFWRVGFGTGQSKMPHAASSLSLRATALDHWSLTPSSPLSLQASASESLACRLEHLAKQHYPVDGTRIREYFDAGERNRILLATVRFKSTKASAWSEPVNNLAVNLHASGNTLKSTAQLQASGRKCDRECFVCTPIEAIRGEGEALPG